MSAVSWRASVQLHRIRALLWSKVVNVKLHALDRAIKANFDPSQPRVPAGNPNGGQWTDAGGGGESTAPSRGGDQGSGASSSLTLCSLPFRQEATMNRQRS